MEHVKKPWDAIIVGGAAIGLSIAHLLSRQGLRVCVLEAKAGPPSDGRVLSLNPSSQKILENMNIWSAIVEETTPIRGVEISLQGRFPKVPLRDSAGAPLGYSVPLDTLQQVLIAQAPFEIHPNTNIVSMVSTPMGWMLEDAHHQRYETTLLIGADGAHSWIRKQLGIGHTTQAYHQVALIGKIRFEHPHQGQAYERFCKSGALALIPMQNHDMALIWMMPEVESPKGWSIAMLQENLRNAFGDRLGAIMEVAPFQCYPLSTTRSAADTARNAVLLGQSAHQLHPVGAQGFNIALEDAAVLAAYVQSSIAKGEGVTTAHMLATYAVERRPAHQAIARVVDHIARYLIAGRMPRWLQSMGLHVLAWLPPVQEKIRAIGRGTWV